MSYFENDNNIDGGSDDLSDESSITSYDDLDDLINQIIMIEKAHKHTSQGGTIRKHEQITSKINQFLNSES